MKGIEQKGVSVGVRKWMTYQIILLSVEINDYMCLCVCVCVHVCMQTLTEDKRASMQVCNTYHKTLRRTKIKTQSATVDRTQ